MALVATPIGNLGDLSLRAADALRGADVVYCEDTRRTGRLLQHLQHRAPSLRVVDEHREEAMIPEIVDRLEKGFDLVLVSDAGTPGISDPGERIVAAVLGAGHPVDVIPGPAAVITALVGSGLPTGRFVFEGFLPRRGSGRTARLGALAGEQRTIVLYEAPHRLERTLADLVGVCGPDRQVVVARELTKLHEERWRGPLGEALAWAGAREPRGEYVIVLAGADDAPPAGDEEIRAALDAERSAGLSTRDAVAVVTERFGVAKRRVYDLATGDRDGRS